MARPRLVTVALVSVFLWTAIAALTFATSHYDVERALHCEGPSATSRVVLALGMGACALTFAAARRSTGSLVRLMALVAPLLVGLFFIGYPSWISFEAGPHQCGGR